MRQDTEKTVSAGDLESDDQEDWSLALALWVVSLQPFMGIGEKGMSTYS